jgi:hypothetical protein
MADILITLVVFYNQHSELYKYRQLCGMGTADDTYKIQNVGYVVCLV